MIKDKTEKGAHVGFPSLFCNLTALGHPHTWCVRSRGAVLVGQGTPGACRDNTNMSAAFLGMVCGEEPLRYLYHNYLKG